MSAAPPHADLLVADGLVTIFEAAQFLRLSRSTVYDLLGRDLLPSARIGRARRIPKRALIEFAARHLCGGQEESR